ncbi:hypothetical protein MtrunA17_Chr7g0261541 [Medicago truncatula]|uniref:Transmembrane protein n=1 Tax=Medicago truncatula TaxID=3880 RepID=A0A396H6S9_MEDTR|nr:hypothetical protein MtrunA17_Chr7g0261541 [Medicago truncatula]
MLQNLKYIRFDLFYHTSMITYVVGMRLIFSHMFHNKSVWYINDCHPYSPVLCRQMVMLKTSRISPENQASDPSKVYKLLKLTKS